MNSIGPSLSIQPPSIHGNGNFRAVLPKPRSGRKRDRAAKQEALIRAATKLFACEVTTTREIAASAGCAEGLIHRYFQGKAGLLLALMSHHASRDVGELSDRLPLANNMEEEIQQLMEWEVERMWRDRDLLRASLPHAILDPKVGRFISRVGPQRHAKAIAERLRRHEKGSSVSDDEIDAISQAIGALGFSFGFMRPVVFGFDNKQARKVAACVGKIFSRGLKKH
jgi:AcrR family transcriptional regulator